MTDSQALRAALREAAERARDWHLSEVRTVEGEYMVCGGLGNDYGLIAAVTEGQEAEFIAQAPAAILSLLSDLDRVERERDEAVEALRNLHKFTVVGTDQERHNALNAAWRVIHALSSSPVVGGGEGIEGIPERVTGGCGEQPEPAVEAAAALARIRTIMDGDGETTPLPEDDLDRILEFEEHVSLLSSPGDTASLTWPDQRKLISEAILASRVRDLLSTLPAHPVTEGEG